MSTFFDSPFVYQIPDGLIGPDFNGHFFGPVTAVPLEGWEAQSVVGSNVWYSGETVAEAINPNRFVRARPVPPEPLPVGTEVVVHGSYVATILAADGLWYWVRRTDAIDRYGNPTHSDHDFLPVMGHPDDDECTYRSDGTDDTYCGLPAEAHDPLPPQDYYGGAQPATWRA